VNEQKLLEAKRQFDSLIGLPNSMLRKGVARVGDPLTGIIDYNYKVLRDKESGRYKVYLEWVDLDGSGNRVVLPHEVIIAILRANDSLIKQSRKEGAKKGAETRRMRAVNEAESILTK
jgi:hypothetical protein